jgi:hypothetical protein
MDNKNFFEIHIYKGHPAFFNSGYYPYKSYSNIETYIETSFDALLYAVSPTEKTFIEGFNYLVDYLLSEKKEKYFLQEAKKNLSRVANQYSEAIYLLGIIKLLEGKVSDAINLFRLIKDFSFPLFTKYYRVPTIVVKQGKEALYITPTKEAIESFVNFLNS